MKKQLLLSTLAIVAVAGYLHADENSPQDNTRDVNKEKKAVTEETTKRVAKVVVAAEEAEETEKAKKAEKEKSDVKRKKSTKDKKDKKDMGKK